MASYRDSLDILANKDELIVRIGRVQPSSVRQWGTMTPHEMLCHLGDSFAAVLGDIQASSMETFLSRTVVRWIALHTSLPWPQGVKTRPEVNPKETGTKPSDFERDRQRVVDLMQRFVSDKGGSVRHPIFGELSRDEWLRWGYRHVDHHLRQFGE